MIFEQFIKGKLKECINKAIELNTLNISTAILHQNTFLPYKNYCKGEQAVVICGAGPSLQKYQPIKGAVHIALNRAFLYERVAFDFIFSQDFDGIRMVQKELIEYEGNNCVKLLGSTGGAGAEKEIPESLALQCNALRFYTDSYIYGNGYKSKFVLDIGTRPLGGMPNVGISVMQFALYMNPSAIYIVGCDMSGGHFVNPDLSEKAKEAEKREFNKYWEEEKQLLLGKWRELKEFARINYPATRIISVNPIGLKGIFEDFYQEDCE